MNEEKNKLNNNLPASSGGPWWKQGVQVFSEVSTWIFVPIILALVVGKYLDGRWNTKPAMLLVLAGVGFLITAYGIVRTVRNYMIKINKK